MATESQESGAQAQEDQAAARRTATATATCTQPLGQTERSSAERECATTVSDLPPLHDAPSTSADGIGVGNTCDVTNEKALQPDLVSAATFQALSGAVLRQMEAFATQLKDHLRVTASSSRSAFDRLYNEMQGYKNNFLREAQRPLLTDLMLLFDSIEQLHANYASATHVDLETLRNNLDTLRLEAEEILVRAGVERMLATPDRIDVRLQQAIRAIATDDPDEHLLIVQRIKAGFMADDRPLRKELVIIKRHTPSKSAGLRLGGDEKPATGAGHEPSQPDHITPSTDR